MKAVLMSIKHKWCELIFSGEKIIDVRKKAPKLKPPFKAYVYQTKGKEPLLEVIKDGDDLYGEVYHGETVFVKGCHRGLGKVVGEFVCDRVDDYTYDYCDGVDIDDDSLLETCFEWSEINIYANGKKLHGLHITEPKLYDTPKELSEFVSCKYYHEGECLLSNKTHCKYRVPDLNPDGSVNIFECKKRVTRPPQSWMYVEELC